MAVDGVFNDLDRLAKHGANGDQSLVSSGNPDHAAATYTQMITLYDLAELHGSKFIALVRAKYP